MSIGNMIGGTLIEKGIDQFTFGIGKEYDRYEYNKKRSDLEKDQRQQWRLEFDQKMLAAKDFGIHPLAMLGTTSPAGNVIHSGGTSPPYSSGSLTSAMTQGLRNDAQKELIKEQVEGVKLDNEGKRIQNAVNAKRLLEMDKPPQPVEGSDSLGGISGQQSSISTLPTSFYDGKKMFSSHSNVAQGVTPLEKYTVDQDGNIILTFTQESSEALENDWFAKTFIFGNKVARVAKSWNYYLNSSSNDAMRFRAKARRFRASLGRAPKGYQFSFSPESGNFKLEKFHGRFYTNGIGGQPRKKNIRY